jgi:short-subunit dehydrogenase
VLVARNASNLAEAAEEIKKINANVEVLTQAMDICNEDAVKELFAKIKSDFGTADVLINNAGSGRSALPIKQIDPKDFWYDFVSDTPSSSIKAEILTSLCRRSMSKAHS